MPLATKLGLETGTDQQASRTHSGFPVSRENTSDRGGKLENAGELIRYRGLMPFFSDLLEPATHHG
jgi:hypothetical protein